LGFHGQPNLADLGPQFQQAPSFLGTFRQGARVEVAWWTGNRCGGGGLLG
jgi:hypothetical protein